MSRRGVDSTKFKDYEVQGMQIPIHVTLQGRFEARVGDRWYEKKNLADLQKQIREAVAAQNLVRIDATLIKDGWSEDPPDFTDVIIGGHDARRGPLYFELDGEGNPEATTHNGHTQDFYARLTPEDRTECVWLWQVKQDAATAYDTWLTVRKLEVERLVGEATAAALQQPAAEEEA